jgi:hypothetical protein
MVGGDGCLLVEICLALMKRRDLRLTRYHIRNVTGTLRSQERPKLKSSLFSLSIKKLVVGELTEDEEVWVRRVRPQQSHPDWGAVTC